MKKIYAIILASFLFGGITKAQTPLTQAVDFTVTDLQGNSHNLFSILAQNKYVCLDFWFVACPPCQQTSPYFKTAYQNYGCNTANVFFMSIDNGDNNASCTTFENTYLGGNAGYPVVSGVEGTGSAVNTAYQIGAYPTYILIAPNHTIVQQDMWPISSAASFDPYFSSSGLSYSACASGVAAIASPFDFNLFPNPVVSVLTIESNKNAELISYRIFDYVGNVSLTAEIANGSSKISIDVSSLPAGFYFAEVRTSDGFVVKKINKL